MKIIVDANALCYRTMYAMIKSEQQLSVEDMKTEIIFGFIMALPVLAEMFDSNEFIFVWDSGKYFRKDIFPEYKGEREEKSPEEIEALNLSFPQFKQLRKEVLPQLGFNNNLIQTGMETDDIIAAITKNYEDEFVIISRDGDLYQLLSSRVSMYDPTFKRVTTQETFREKWDIHPNEWWLVKAIAGCSSDNVPGVPGVAEKTAIKYMKNLLKPTTKAFRNITAWKKKIDRNVLLVKLPYEGTIVPEIVPDELISGKFLAMFDYYNFQSQLTDERFATWVKLFKL